MICTTSLDMQVEKGTLIRSLFHDLIQLPAHTLNQQASVHYPPPPTHTGCQRSQLITSPLPLLILCFSSHVSSNESLCSSTPPHSPFPAQAPLLTSQSHTFTLHKWKVGPLPAGLWCASPYLAGKGLHSEVPPLFAPAAVKLQDFEFAGSLDRCSAHLAGSSCCCKHAPSITGVRICPSPCFSLPTAASAKSDLFSRSIYS